MGGSEQLSGCREGTGTASLQGKVRASGRPAEAGMAESSPGKRLSLGRVHVRVRACARVCACAQRPLVKRERHPASRKAHRGGDPVPGTGGCM